MTSSSVSNLAAPDEMELPALNEWSGQSEDGFGWRVICADALDALREMPDKEVNTVITSPPYFWLRDYGVDGQIGLEDSVEDYVSGLSSILNELTRPL